jgi:hypothetical protein
MRCRLIHGLIGWITMAAVAAADVGDPTLRTDHPHYPGEGAFQSVEDCVRFATKGKTEPQEKAIALYLWLLKHQWHLASPQDCAIPGKTPDIRNGNLQELIVADANRARFSFGYGLCGTVHAWNEPYWKALGMNARRRAFPGHTNSEIEYGGSWHAFDTDMAGLIFRKDGIVAGYEDVMRDPECAARVRLPLPHYPFDWPKDFNTMKAGWAEVATGQAQDEGWFKMYNGSHATHPGIVHLRSGESFTRYANRDGLAGKAKRQFWHIGKGGPERNWSFFGPGEVTHRADQSNSRGHPSYGNGVFDYRPDLEGTRWREGLAGSANLSHSPQESPKVAAIGAETASVTFCHFSPYVICGAPADGVNPMTGPATGGLIVQGSTVGTVTLAISTDQGQTWRHAGTVSGSFEKDFTDLVKGFYGWQVRFSWSGASGIDRLRFLTTTQICQAIYPQLQAGGSQVEYRASSRAVVPILPNLGGPETDFAALEVRSLRSPHLVYEARGASGLRAFFTTHHNKPATVVFRVDSPQELTDIAAAGKFSVRVPPPMGCDFHWDISPDEGKSWHPLGKAEVPPDNAHSSGWMSGTADVSRFHTRSIWVRAQIFAGGYPTSLTQVQIYGVRKTPSPTEVKITHGWREDGVKKTHEEILPPGIPQKTYQVPTGKKIEDLFVRIEAP